jgi:hypothetical protein
MEKLITIDESVNFYSKPDVNDTKKRRVEKNEELNIIKIEKEKDEYWINVISENSLEGYTNELDKIAILLPVTLSKQQKVIVFQQPDANSTKLADLQKNEVFYLVHKTFDTQDQTIIWKKVKLENGKFGYINTDNNLIPVNKAEKKRKINCLYAALIIAGLLIIFAIISHAAGHNEGIPFISVAIISAIFYSLFLLISGIFKTKMEKHYYPNLLSVYNNEKIV